MWSHSRVCRVCSRSERKCSPANHIIDTPPRPRAYTRSTRHRVLEIHREKIGSIRLDVNEGQWRYLTEEEVNSFSK